MRKILTVFLLVFISIIFFKAALYAKDDEDYIKWMDFDVPVNILKLAYEYDVNSQNEEYPLDFVQLLAYTAAANWGSFEDNDGSLASMHNVVERIRSGELLSDITADMKLYEHYLVAYGAVLGGFVGPYEVKILNEADPDGFTWEKRYGLKVFSPIAGGYSFTHSNDFGNPRSYGYKRRHLGHDLFGTVGTPIIAVEDGIVERLGWNQYGGWRIGIRSMDKKRYYYYAHLRKGRPYAAGLGIGSVIQSGDVIGYLGATGYSLKEDVSNIKTPHLHFGIQIIFDESQVDGTNQIWIDAYGIMRFLNQNRMKVVKNDDGEYVRTVDIVNIPFE